LTSYLPEDAPDRAQPFTGFHLYYPSRKQASPFSLVVDALRYRSGSLKPSASLTKKVR